MLNVALPWLLLVPMPVQTAQDPVQVTLVSDEAEVLLPTFNRAVLARKETCAMWSPELLLVLKGTN